MAFCRTFSRFRSVAVVNISHYLGFPIHSHRVETADVVVYTISLGLDGAIVTGRRLSVSRVIVWSA